MLSLITLPDQDTMRARLESHFKTRNRQFKKKLYPELLEGAGRQLVPQGIIMIIQGALYALGDQFWKDNRLVAELIPVIVPDATQAEETKKAMFTPTNS